MIPRWLRAPELAAPALQDRAEVVHATLLAIGGAVAVTGPLMLASAPLRLASLFLLPFVGVIVVVQGLLRLHRVDAAAGLLISLLGGALAVLTFSAGGLDTGVSPVLLVVAMMGTLALGARPGLALTGFAAAVQAVEFAVGASDRWVVVDVPMEQHLYVTTVATISATGLLTSWSVHHLRRRLATIRERAERLGRAREYTHGIVRRMGEAVFVVHDGRIELANSAGAQLLGVEEGALHGARASMLLGPVAGGEARGNGLVARLDGARVPVRWSRSELVDDRGRSIDVYVVSDDRVRIEAEQRSLAAARAALSAVEGRTRFLSTMSHELRTPLNAVIGYSELLVDELGETPVAADARRIRDAAQHLLALVGDVLDSSTGVAGETPIVDLTAEEVGEIAQGCVLTLRPLAQKRQNRLSVRVLPGAPAARGDARLVRQTLLNLLSNAVKFTEHGDVEVIVGPGSPGLRLSVRDTGKGIAPDRLDQVFQPYVQADARSGVVGTGLGLNLCLQFAERMGGRMEVSSALGAGSTFSLVLAEAGAPPAPDPGEPLVGTARRERLESHASTT